MHMPVAAPGQHDNLSLTLEADGTNKGRDSEQNERLRDRLAPSPSVGFKFPHLLMRTLVHAQCALLLSWQLRSRCAINLWHTGLIDGYAIKTKLACYLASRGRVRSVAVIFVGMWNKGDYKSLSTLSGFDLAGGWGSCGVSGFLWIQFKTCPDT